MPTAKPKPEEKEPTVADLRHMADLYHVPITDATLDGVAKGGLTPQKATAFEEYIKTAAQGLYPTLAPQIKAGIPTAYLLDPYRQIAKQKLGDDYEPNFQSDPAATAALTGGTDPQSGRPAPMSLDQWKTHLMTAPAFGYDKTPEAISRAHESMQALAQSIHEGGQQ